MTEPARVRRTRPVAIQMTGRIAQAMSRRNRPSETATEGAYIADYFGEEADTPVMELLKATPPTTQVFRGKPGGNLHVSDVIGKCLRKIILMERLEQRHPAEKIMDGRGVTFAIGDALGAFVTKRIAAGHASKIWANWKCRCGETSWKGFLSKARKFTCEVCERPLDQHNEVPFADAEWMVTGSPDILLYLDEYGAYHVVELKSMAAGEWKELARPLPDHVIQVTFYWHILHRAGWPLVNRCSILYTNKEFSFKNPYKEFLVNPQNEGVLDPYLEDLEVFRAARAGGDLPPRSGCPSQDSPNAKACPVNVTCFGCE